MNSRNYEEAVLKGVARAKIEIKNQKKGHYNRRLIASAVAIFIFLFIGVKEPSFIKALQDGIQSFDAFSAHLFGEATGRFQDVANTVMLAKENETGIITIEEVVLDDNILMISLMVESEFLKEPHSGVESDFFNLDYRLFINGHEVLASSPKVRRINETTGAIIIEANVTDSKVGEEANIDLRVSEITRGDASAHGKWDFKFKASKLQGATWLNPNHSMSIKDSLISLKQVVKSPLATTIDFTVEGELAEEIFKESDIVACGDNEVTYEVRLLQGTFDSVHQRASFRLLIEDSLEGIESLMIYPSLVEERSFVSKDNVSYLIYQVVGAKSNQENIKQISREATKEERDLGYALDTVDYYVNMSDDVEFKMLSELIEDSIWVNETEQVIVEEVRVGENEVEFIFQLGTNYLPHLLNSIVLFDETFNGYTKDEGEFVLSALDKEARKYSVRFENIDCSKRYIVALPKVTELSDTAYKWSLEVPLQ